MISGKILNLYLTLEIKKLKSDLKFWQAKTLFICKLCEKHSTCSLLRVCYICKVRQKLLLHEKLSNTGFSQKTKLQ